MVNLIGLIVGRSLAQRADLPENEAARISLLGAASPSPLMGAVLVEAAIRQQRRTGAAVSSRLPPSEGLVVGSNDVLEEIRKTQWALGEFEGTLANNKEDVQAAHDFWDKFQQATMQLTQAVVGETPGRAR
ncbi:hypothetical protein OG426_54850 (plasmid) [Streptomyces canus]|uniref:hypothetical protein n=1 Tax=Streptomyces canus TaxID=58343 RepID=UPI002F90CDFB|nr:hypothetical protein OG426_54850 [Streptomyces canus]